MKTPWLPSRCFLVESILSLLAGFFALLAVLLPEWLESFGVHRDYGNGALEWTVPVAMALIAVIFGVKAGRRWRIDVARVARARG